MIDMDEERVFREAYQLLNEIKISLGGEAMVSLIVLPVNDGMLHIRFDWPDNVHVEIQLEERQVRTMAICEVTSMAIQGRRAYLQTCSLVQ